MKVGLLTVTMAAGAALVAARVSPHFTDTGSAAILGEIIPGGLFLCAVLGGLLTLGFRGHLLSKKAPRIHPAIPREDLLKLAAAKNGQLTIFQTAVAFDVDEQNAEAALEQMVREGVAYRVLNDEGVLIFFFKT